MLVSKLIEILKTLPSDKPIRIFWDGEPRSIIEGIVNDDEAIVFIADWSIYRSGGYRKYEDEKIIYEIIDGDNEDDTIERESD